MRLVIIKDGVVTNVITAPEDWQTKWTPPNDVTVLENATAQIGWLYDGTTLSPDSVAATNAIQAVLRTRFKEEALKRIASQVPAWNTVDRVEFLLSFVNMLNAANMTAAQNNAKLIYLYARDAALPKLNTLTLSELEQVDPTATQPFLSVDPGDTGWPF